jgi:hypothetical protein
VTGQASQGGCRTAVKGCKGAAAECSAPDTVHRMAPQGSGSWESEGTSPGTGSPLPPC